VTIGGGHIKHRRAIDIDSGIVKLVGDQARIVASKLNGQSGIALEYFPKHGRRRRLAPMRRAKPCHPPAFLIDQDWRVAPQAISQFPGQRPHLFGPLAIAGKQNESQGIADAKKIALVSA
jgi:hypothetical protein